MIANIKQVFLIGIGGIGMSALARYFKHQGLLVFGYDKTKTGLTEQLEQEGIAVFYADNPDLLPEVFKSHHSDALVIYTPAVPQHLQIVRVVKAAGYRLYKRSEVLGMISKQHFTIAVAGTHGKTTTSSMIAHILTHSGYGCSAFLGGIAVNYNSNVLFGDNQVVVVEADEFDRSFLTLHPNIAVVTSMDPDHLDIYGDLRHLIESFALFIAQVAADGKRIIRKGLDLPTDISYGVETIADAHGDNVQVLDGVFQFDYHFGDQVVSQIKLGAAGKHNVENAIAAITVAKLLRIDDGAIKTALATYKGVKRRFEFIVKKEDQVYIDDYAHHPEELKACLSAVRALYPHEQITCIFQPHLFSRTRDFAAGFAEVLAMADTLILMDIYPAREEPIAGVTSQWLLDQVRLKDKCLLDAEGILRYVKERRPKVLLTVGAGDIDLMVKPLKEVLTDV